MKFGYARVSTVEQDFSAQIDALNAANCDRVFHEKCSAASLTGRTELQKLLEFVRPQDSIVVTKVDRIARSVKDLQDIVHDLRKRNVRFQCLDQPIDTDTAAGKCFLDMLGVFAEFENSLRHERQLVGIERAKKEGKYKGRKPSVPVDEVRRLRDEGMKPTHIAEHLKISRTSVYRAFTSPVD